MAFLNSSVVERNVVTNHHERAVPEDALQGHRVTTIDEVVDREGVTQSVRMDTLDASTVGHSPYYLSQPFSSQGPAVPTEE